MVTISRIIGLAVAFAAGASLSASGAVTLFDFETAAEVASAPNFRNASTAFKVVNRFAASGTNSLHWTCKPWKKGLDEWPSFTLTSPVADWSKYDRMVVELVNLGGSGDAFSTFIAEKEGRIQNGLSRSTRLPSSGHLQWVVPLKDWPKTADPHKIARVHFFTDKAHGFDVYLDRVILLAKGEPLPQPAYAMMGRDLVPLLTKRVEQAEASAAAAKSAIAHIDAYWRLRSACGKAGQDVSKLVLAQASSMVKVRPRAEVPVGVRPADRLSVRLARSEKESVQLLVAPGDADLKKVRVRAADLKSSDGTVFAAANVKPVLTGYVCTTHKPPYQVGYMAVTNSAGDYCRRLRAPEVGWWPDPILDHMDTCDIRDRDLQSFWVRVTCPENQKAGVYTGALTVEAQGLAAVQVPFTVRVNDFAVPKKSPLPLAITFWPEANTQLETEENLASAAAIRKDPGSPLHLWQPKRLEWGDFLADYYITMDSLYGNTRLQWDVLARLKEQGRLGWFNLGYWSYFGKGEDAEAKWRAATLPRLRANYEKAKELGIVDHAYLYGCDEIAKEYFPEIRKAVECLKKEFPGVPIFTTAYDHEFGVGTELGCMDWFTPLTPKFDCAKAAAARREGRQVWWYICCGPHSPYANMFIENSAIEGRMLMGPQTVRMRPDGFLYYEITIWNMMRPLSKGPFTDWNPRSWTTYHGDGSWTCMGPGGRPLATQRLENFRDGLEDYAYALELERRLRARKSQDDDWAKRAKALLAVPRDVMVDMKNYTDDADALLRWRDAMAELIETAMR